MKKKVYEITGLGGTGKTHEIKEQIQQAVKSGINPKHILYSCFNRSLRKKAKKELPNSKQMNIYTIHGLCHKVLDTNNKLPKGFKSRFEDKQEEKEKLNYQALIDGFLRLKDSEIKKEIPSLELIIIDEIQDLKKSYLKVLFRLDEIFNVNFIIAGDPYQAINGFEKDYEKLYEDNFKRFREKYGIENVETKILNRNRRSTFEVGQLVNSFLEKAYSDMDFNYQYTFEKVTAKKYSRPLFRWCKNREDEKHYIKSEIQKKGKGKKIVILSQYNRYLALFETDSFYINNSYEIKISTIHKYKGSEADMVFLVGFNIPEDYNETEKNVLYVGLSRAKKQLYVTSSFPKIDLTNHFDKRTYREVGKQTAIVSKYKQLKKIKENTHFTYNKLKDSVIDSICFKVLEKDAPFLPYVKKDNSLKKGDDDYSNRYKVVNKEVEVTVEFNNRHRYYSFQFYDINLLHKNGYGDKNVFQFCLNFIYEYFDYRITPDQIYITMLHLHKLIKVKDKQEREDLTRAIVNLGMYNNPHSIRDHEKKKEVKKIYYSKDERVNEIKEDLSHKSIYINYTSSKRITIAIYNPNNKANQNRINISDIIKVEIRIDHGAIENKSILGSENKAQHLLQIFQSTHSLSFLYDSVFVKQFTIKDRNKQSEGYHNALAKLRGFNEFEKIIKKV